VLLGITNFWVFHHARRCHGSDVKGGDQLSFYTVRPENSDKSTLMVMCIVWNHV